MATAIEGATWIDRSPHLSVIRMVGISTSCDEGMAWMEGGEAAEILKEPSSIFKVIRIKTYLIKQNWNMILQMKPIF